MIELAVGVRSELPDSWVTAAIGEIATLSPKFIATDIDVADPVHFVPMAAVAEDFGGIDVSQARPYGEVRKGYTYFAERDVLFAKITPCMENGKGALVPYLKHDHAFGSTEFHVLRPQGAVRPKWLANYLSQPDFRRVARHNMTGTAGQLRVSTKWLGLAGIPVPPLAEQNRIVEKLEELLSDLDAGVAELKAAQRKLAQYRQSLLKAAVEGALTADWRAARIAASSSSSLRKQGPSDSRRNTTKSLDSRVRGNDGHAESGADLLQRILTERRARWEARQLAKFAEQGKTPPKDWKAKYPEPVAPDTNDLPALPGGWVWSSMDQCALDESAITDGPFGSNLKSSHYTASGPRVLRLQNIGDGHFVDAKAHISEGHFAEMLKHSVAEGDLVIAMLGEVLPRACIVPSNIAPAIVKADCARVRPNPALISSTLLSAVLNSEPTRKRVVPLVKGIGRPRVNLGNLRSIAVPLPPTTEQQAICDALTIALDASEVQNEALLHGLRLAAAQRKNILKAAFAGQLVPQDPHDEPASMLLERIRAERAMGGTMDAKRGRKAKEAL